MIISVTDRQRQMLVQAAKSFYNADKDIINSGQASNYGIPDDVLIQWRDIIKKLRNRKLK